MVLQTQDGTSPLMGERLSCWSSGLPWFVVPDNGVEDCEQLSCGSDESDAPGFAGGQEALVEGLERGVVARCNHGADEQGRTGCGAAAADDALAAPLA